MINVAFSDLPCIFIYFRNDQQIEVFLWEEAGQSLTIPAKNRPKDSGTLDGDDVSHVGSFPACNAVPLSFAPRL